MNKLLSLSLVLMLVVTPLLADQAPGGNTWSKVRYNGGTLQTKVKPDDWNNKLTVGSDLIEFDLNDGQKIKIDPKTVTALSYGQEAHRRVGTMVALAILISPAALFGLFHKTKLHFIGIEYEQDGKKAGLLMQGDKGNYRAILLALKAVTGKDVQTAEEDKGTVKPSDKPAPPKDKPEQPQ